MALIDNLVGYWKLDEASGTRYDSHSTNDLSESGGTTSSTTGKISSAAIFTASTQYLSPSSTSLCSFGDADFSIQIWVKLTTKSSSQRVVSKFALSHGEYQIRYNAASDVFEFEVWSSAGYGGSGKVSTSSGISTGAWYHIIAYHDAAANQIGIVLNNGTPVTTSHSTGVYPVTIAFRLGDSVYGEAPDAAFDELAFWSKVLTGGEISSLYNGGSGLAYPFTAAGVVVTPLQNRVMSPGHIFGGKCLC